MMLKNIYRDFSVEYTDLKDMMKNLRKKFGDCPAFIFKRNGIKTEISYERFAQDIDAFGTYLLNKGYNGKKIAVVGENSYEWIVTYFATVNSANIMIPIDKELTPPEIQTLLDASQTDLLVYSQKKQGAVDEMKQNGLSVENFICMTDMEKLIAEGRQLIADGDENFNNIEIIPEKMCEIIYTSGTTGTPKGVMLSHKNLARDAFLSISCMRIPRNTVLVLPLNHTFGFMAGLLCQLWMGYYV